MRRAPVLLVVTSLLAIVFLAGCTSKAASAQQVSVTSSDTACEVSETSLGSGPTTFVVANRGNDVTEVYVYADGTRIIGEVENIGAGSSRSFTVDLGGGEYEVACKPGQTGDGIRTSISVAGTTTTTAAPSRTIQVTAHEWGYDGLDFLVAKERETVKFVLTNKGTVDHEMEVRDPDGEVVGEVEPTAPGTSGEVTVTFYESGEWAVQCGIEGHLEHGMRRTFSVT
jgi:iron uptake system component EfeO